MHELIADSAQTPEEKIKLNARADEIFSTLLEAGVVVRGEDAEGRPSYELTVELPEDFALDQPLSPFLLAALDLLDPESPDYALDVISLVEATLENPAKVLRAQERKARDAAMAEMKADGVEYEERLERLAEITYPKPLEELLDRAFELYCQGVPWARDYELLPKSVLRDMVETASDFKTYIGRYGIAKSEGTLLRYLSDAFRVLVRTLPPARHHRLARLHGAHHRLVAGGCVGERRRAARSGRTSASGGRRGGRPSRHGGHGAQRIVCPRAPGRARSHPRAGQP